MKNRSSHLSSILILVSSTLCAQSLLDSANNAYFNFRVVDAKKSYEEIWASTKSINEKTEAGKQLMKIYEQFYKDYDQAREYADTLLDADPENFEVPYRMAGLSIEAEKYDDAGKYLEECLKRADNGYQVKITHIRSAEYILSKSQHELSVHKPVHPDEIREALDHLLAYYELEPENLEISRYCLGLALLLEKDEMVLDAFITYFRIPENEAPGGLLADAQSMITKGLHSKNDKEDLARGLALSRFYDYAVMTIHQYGLDYIHTPDLADILNYFAFINETEATVFDYFRQKALGVASDEDYSKEYYTRCIEFWGKLSWETDTPVFYEEGFEDELFKRFGTKINTGEGGMDIGFFAGHNVVNEKQEIEQYGRKSKITYLSLDYIVGNIYPHWYFGFFGVGGWNTNKQEVMSIRTVNFNGNSPLRAFNRLVDENEREKWQAEIAEKSARDDSIARIHPYELLEGLGERLKFQSYSRIIDSLTSIHDDPTALKIHFLSCTDDILVESVVLNHEGRHSLDSYVDYPNNTVMFSAEEREFRANLSGLAFSLDPKLIIAENTLIPQDPAHENANRRIIMGLVEWMELHKTEIEGLEYMRPMLPQLDLLTNDQIVRATRCIDPLYVNYVASGY
ncbi:MAG: tetratricopeptide repeat protein [Bacteroidales bacterium]